MGGSVLRVYMGDRVPPTGVRPRVRALVSLWRSDWSDLIYGPATGVAPWVTVAHVPVVPAPGASADLGASSWAGTMG